MCDKKELGTWDGPSQGLFHLRTGQEQKHARLCCRPHKVYHFFSRSAKKGWWSFFFSFIFGRRRERQWRPFGSDASFRNTWWLTTSLFFSDMVDFFFFILLSSSGSLAGETWHILRHSAVYNIFFIFFFRILEH